MPELREVLQTIERTSRDYRIQISVREYSQSLWSSPILVAGEFTADWLGSTPTIHLEYSQAATPQLIFWAFLHELGHYQQWQESPGPASWNLSSPLNIIRAERDAWRRARQLAQSTICPPDSEFDQLMKECLFSYHLAS